MHKSKKIVSGRQYIVKNSDSKGVARGADSVAKMVIGGRPMKPKKEWTPVNHMPTETPGCRIGLDLPPSEAKEINLLAKHFGIEPYEMARQLIIDALLSPKFTSLVESFGDRVRIRGGGDWRAWTQTWRESEGASSQEGGHPGTDGLQGISPSPWTGPLRLKANVLDATMPARLQITIEAGEKGFGVRLSM